MIDITESLDWVLDLDLAALKAIYLAEMDQSARVKNFELLKESGELRYRFLNEGFDPEEGPAIRRHIQPTADTIYLEADQKGGPHGVNYSTDAMSTQERESGPKTQHLDLDKRF